MTMQNLYAGFTLSLSLMFGLSVKMRSFKPKSSGLLPGVLRSENLDTSGNLGKFIPFKQLERVCFMKTSFKCYQNCKHKFQTPRSSIYSIHDKLSWFLIFSSAQDMHSHFLPHLITSRYAFSNAAFAGAGSKNHAPAFSRCRRLAPGPLPGSFCLNHIVVLRESFGDSWDHEY